MRTSVLVRAPEGEFVIDTGPELRLQLVREQARLIRAAVFTHAHADHIMGLDDLRIFGFKLKSDIPLFCEPSVETFIRQTFSYAFLEPSAHAHPYAAPRFRFEQIEPGTEFELLGLKILPLRVFHGKLPILGFRIGNVAFCTDVSAIPSETRELLTGLDALVIDALRHEPHPTHMSVDQALKAIRTLKPRKAYLTHMSHELDYDELCEQLPADVRPAHDGLRIALS
jgi:phosphoribosyl 1,2-cyclic phosphate phosphodiesterase